MAHVQILLTILALIGVALTIEKTTTTRFSVSLLYATIFISIVLYFGGLANYLEITATTVRVIGWIGLISCLMQLKKWQIKADEIYILVSAIGFYIFCQREPYSIFPFIDDYSHWGRMSRYITENNRLIVNSDAIGVKYYPPIAALFHYFFTHFSGYQDNLTIFANGLLIIIFSAPILVAVSKYEVAEKKLVLALTSLSLYSIFWIFGLGLHSLWADLLLGFSFGIGLYIYFNQGYQSKNAALLANIPILLYMTQIKQIGILFSIFTLVIIGMDYFKSDKSKLLRKLIIIGSILLGLILFEWTWTKYLNIQNIETGFKISLTQIFSVFNPVTNTERQSVTISRFIDYFFFSHHLSTFWFLVTLILFGGIAAFKKKNKLELKLTPFGLAYLFFVAYSISLLFLYLFSFSPYEGPRLASIDRYILTYILGLLIFFGGTLINISSTGKNIKYKFYLLTIAMMITLPNAGRILLDTVTVVLNTAPLNEAGEISKISKYVEQKTSKNSKIYIIWSDGSNDESVIFSYFLMPRVVNTECSFVKSPHSLRAENDVWSCSMSTEQFKDRISGYDYLLLAKPSEEFLNYFGERLKIQHVKNQTILFKIVNAREFKLEVMP